MPINGEVTEFNEELEDAPELINSSPYDDGWIIKSTISDYSDLDVLLSSEEYKNLIS
jgi:glycine cleavage system H protein